MQQGSATHCSHSCTKQASDLRCVSTCMPRTALPCCASTGLHTHGPSLPCLASTPALVHLHWLSCKHICSASSSLSLITCHRHAVALLCLSFCPICLCSPLFSPACWWAGLLNAQPAQTPLPHIVCLHLPPPGPALVLPLPCFAYHPSPVTCLLVGRAAGCPTQTACAPQRSRGGGAPPPHARAEGG